MTSKFAAAAAVTLLTATSFATPAFAARYIRAYAEHYGNPNTVNTGAADNAIATYPATGPVSAKETGSYYADAASADYGVLKAKASVTGAPYGTPQENAFAEFADELIINAGAPGTSGVATFRINFDGEVYAENNRSYWQYQLIFKTGSSPIQVLDRTARTTPVTHVEDYLDVIVPFVSGVSTGFDVKLVTWAGVLGLPGTVGSAYADFSHTALWGGLQSVTSGGVDVTKLTTVTSATGYDYQTIPTGAPEPTAWMLMIAGFGLAGACLRTRRRLA